MSEVTLKAQLMRGPPRSLRLVGFVAFFECLSSRRLTAHVYEESSALEDRWQDVRRASYADSDQERTNDASHREVRPLPRRTTTTSYSTSTGSPSHILGSTYPDPCRPLQPIPTLHLISTGVSANIISRSANTAPNRRPLQDVHYTSKKNLGPWRGTVDLSPRDKSRLADRPRERLSWERPPNCSWAPKLWDISSSATSKADLPRPISTGNSAEPPSTFSFVEMSHLLDTIVPSRQPPASSHARAVAPASNPEVSSYAPSTYWADSLQDIRPFQLHVDRSLEQSRIASDQLWTGSGDEVGGSDPWLDSRFKY